MPLAAGARLGPYEIGSPLGAGGMGEVYRARDTRLDRTVAVKVLAAHLALNPDLRQRFEREARAISALSDPHICVLYDVGHQDGIDFLVMECLEGETLGNRLKKKGPLPLDQVFRYGVEVAEALDRAHRQGIVHRDLKPGNVMLTPTGTKLLDFGLAKLRPSAHADEKEPTLTEAGELLGTPRYMAPEQLEGKEPDARSDIFALGVLLYEMATGERAFPAESQAGAITAILSATPAPVSTRRPETPPALDRVVATCLAKDPDERWQSAHDLAAELRWIAQTGGAIAESAGGAAGRARERMAWAAALVLTAGLGIAGVMRGRERPADAINARFEIRPPEKMLFAGVGMALSPDGTRIAFRAMSGGKGSLFVRALDSFEAAPIPGTEGAAAPFFWSPDGRQIAFMAEGQLKKVDLAGGPAHVLSGDAETYVGGSWSREGTIIVALQKELFRLPATGGTPEPLGRRADGELRRSWPQFLPDGRHYLYLSEDLRPERQGIYVAVLGADDRKQIVTTGYNAAFVPPATLLFVRGDELVAQRFDTGRLELSGEPRAVGVQPALNEIAVGSVAGLIPRAVYAVSSTGVLAWRQRGAASTTSLTWFDDGEGAGDGGRARQLLQPRPFSGRAQAGRGRARHGEAARHLGLRPRSRGPDPADVRSRRRHGGRLAPRRRADRVYLDAPGKPRPLPEARQRIGGRRGAAGVQGRAGELRALVGRRQVARPQLEARGAS